MRQDPIRIVPYDPGWPAAFEQQRSRVREALLPWLVGGVEHIGSTSVPGLAAKPIIDMAARTNPVRRAGEVVAAMAAIGWVHAPEPRDEELHRLSFCFPGVAWRTHHLHVLEEGEPSWPVLLAFRDHLCSHPADAAEYARIKAGLAAGDRHDRPAYRAGKAPFIEGILRRITAGE